MFQMGNCEEAHWIGVGPSIIITPIYIVTTSNLQQCPFQFHQLPIPMARFLISTRPFPFSSLPLAPPRAFFRPFTFSPPVRFSAHPSPSRTLRVVKTRAGASTSSYIFAFSIPLSLILITVLTALKIGDNLDKKFLEEVTSIHLISLHFVCGTGFWWDSGGLPFKFGLNKFTWALKWDFYCTEVCVWFN